MMSAAGPAPMSLQRDFWNEWNAEYRESTAIYDTSVRQAQVVEHWLQGLGEGTRNILEVGCGAGWLCPKLSAHGRVTATDLADTVLQRAQQRLPDVTFVPGDFMLLDFGREAFDVIVTLEVLSHVADQTAFLDKLAGHLKPGGHLMMATQNRFVLERYNDISPPRPGQLRRWVDRHELRELLQPRFDVVEIFSVTPIGDRGLMRFVNSRKLNRPVRAILGDRVEKLKERLGLGWTLMALARKRP